MQLALHLEITIFDIWRSIAVLFWGKVYPYIHTFKKEILWAYITCIFPFKCYCFRNVCESCLIPFKDLFYNCSKQNVLILLNVTSNAMARKKSPSEYAYWRRQTLRASCALHMNFILLYFILRRCFIHLLNIKFLNNLDNSPIRPPINDKITRSKRNSPKKLSPVIY